MTCDAHLRTWPSYSSHKSYVKIWFGLVELFKSLRVHKQTNKHTNIKKNHRRNWKQYPSEKFFSGWMTSKAAWLWCAQRGITIIKSIWKSRNLTYLVANTYGLNFIKIGGIWILQGGLHVTCDAHFRTRLTYSSQESCVKIWFGLVEIGGMWIFRGIRSPLLGGGYMCPTMPVFELGRVIPLKSHVWKFGSDWLSLSRVIVSTNKHTNKQPPPQKNLFCKTAQYFLDTHYISENPL